MISLWGGKLLSGVRILTWHVHHYIIRSFTCSCDTRGYTWNSTLLACVNQNECADGVDSCDPGATCVDTMGSFTCQCTTGWVGNGTVCNDRDECAIPSLAAHCDSRAGPCSLLPTLICVDTSRAELNLGDHWFI